MHPYRECKRLKSILILDEFNSLNNGEMARVIGIANAIRILCPNTGIAILSSSPEIDRQRYAGARLKVIERPWYKDSRSKLAAYSFFFVAALITLFWYAILGIVGKKGKLHQYDMFVHITGDVLNDRSLVVLIYHLYHILFGLTGKRIVVVCAESIGPFRSKLAKTLTKLLLNKVDLITVREDVSKEFLDSMKLKNRNTYLTADPAFLLEPTNGACQFDPGKPIMGVCASPDVIPYFSTSFGKTNKDKYEKYTELLACVIDGFLENVDAIAVLIPHVTRSVSDDRIVNKKIYLKLRHQNSVRLIADQCTASEVKEMIANCNVFIGSRMHATIASSSMGVPTIALAHTHKFHGVLGGMLKQRTIIDIRGRDFEELRSRLELALSYAWKNRQAIKKELCKTVEYTRKIAMRNAKLMAHLLDCNTLPKR
jgi:polysaccharide pyruvyl transferase WcaK-like protein